MSFATGLQTAIVTDVGMRRTTNQDSNALIVADTVELYKTRGHLLMVADGMGAHAAGELASKLATDNVPHLYHKHTDLSPPEALQLAVREANTEINRRGNANPDFHNMGTTCSVLVLLPQGAMCCHIGDSRIYRLRGNTVQQLTFDHSLQWELRASGQMPAGADISAVVPKNVITRSMGPNPKVQSDLEGPHPIGVGDVYLLCSDGLTGKVEDAELGAILASLPPKEAAQSLVDLANLRGGPDNCTVLIARVVGPEAATGGNADPIRVGGTRETKPVHPAFWVVAAVGVLAAGVIAMMGSLIGAGVALGVAVIAGAVGLAQKYRGYTSGTTLGHGKILGKGPFTSTVCPPSHDLAQKLADTLSELREAARDGNWSINWRPLDEACQHAAVADKGGNFSEAVRQYCRGISHMMSELRKQNVKKTGSDSAITY